VLFELLAAKQHQNLSMDVKRENVCDVSYTHAILQSTPFGGSTKLKVPRKRHIHRGQITAPHPPRAFGSQQATRAMPCLRSLQVCPWQLGDLDQRGSDARLTPQALLLLD
jgi:hypothetical protein